MSVNSIGPKTTVPSVFATLSTWALVTAIRVSGPAAPWGSGGMKPVENIDKPESMHVSMRVPLAWQVVRLATPPNSGDGRLEKTGNASVVSEIGMSV
jgi:hypothetical protein